MKLQECLNPFIRENFYRFLKAIFVDQDTESSKKLQIYSTWNLFCVCVCMMLSRMARAAGSSSGSSISALPALRTRPSLKWLCCSMALKTGDASIRCLDETSMQTLIGA